MHLFISLKTVVSNIKYSYMMMYFALYNNNNKNNNNLHFLHFLMHLYSFTAVRVGFSQTQYSEVEEDADGNGNTVQVCVEVFGEFEQHITVSLTTVGQSAIGMCTLTYLSKIIIVCVCETPKVHLLTTYRFYDEISLNYLFALFGNSSLL